MTIVKNWPGSLRIKARLKPIPHAIFHRRRFQSARERGRGLTEVAQFGAALRTSAEMLVECTLLVGFESIERGQRQQIFYFLVLHRYRSTRASTVRILIIALRIRVFTVPNGIPSFDAISDCDRSE